MAINQTDSLFPAIVPTSDLPVEATYRATPLLPPDLEDEDEEGEKTKCPCCDCDLNEDESIIHEGTAHCPDCVYTCESCDFTTTDEEDLQLSRVSCRRSSGTQYLCESCRWTCTDCDTNYSNNVDNCGTNCEDQPTCELCAENYSYCESCSSTCPSDSMRETEEGSGEYECESCHTDRESDLIRDHSYKPDPIFHRATNEAVKGKGLYFGVEVEVDSLPGARLDMDDTIIDSGISDLPLLYCKSDGSLTNGFEIVSHPATMAYWREHDCAWMPSLVKSGFRSYDTTTCGMHVHMSRNWFSKLDIVKLLKFFKLNHKFILRLSRRTHKELGNRTPLCHWAAIDERPDKEMCKMVNGRGYDPRGRYRAINLENRRTIEIRIFQGTLSPAGFKRNITFCFALAHFVKTASLKSLGMRAFLRWLGAEGRAIVGKSESKELVKWVRDRTIQPDKGF